MSRGGPEVFVLTDQRHPLEVEAGLLHDVLECLWHHIIFHRALTGKAVTPKDMVLLDDVFYVKCGDARMDKQVSDSAVSARMSPVGLPSESGSCQIGNGSPQYR